MSIFQNSVLKTFKQDEKLVAARWAAFQNYKAKVEAIKDFKEEEYQDGFLKDIFESCLGYTLKTTNPSSFNLEREKKNEIDSKKADGVIYLNSEIIAVIELKDTKTKNLDRVQQQAFWYLTQHTKAKYVIISNFDELRFYFDKSTAYESFSLFNLSYDEFCKLHLLLSFENIKDETALKIKEKSLLYKSKIDTSMAKVLNRALSKNINIKIKHDILHEIKILNEQTFQILKRNRTDRNKLLHNGTIPNRENVIQLWTILLDLLEVAIETKLEKLQKNSIMILNRNLYNHVKNITPKKTNFEQWKKYSEIL